MIRAIRQDSLEFYAHRSGHESWQYCPRRRYLQYHHLQTGIGVYPPIYFEVGTAVHGTDPGATAERAGLAALMEMSKTKDPTIDDMREFVQNSLNLYRGTVVYLNQRQNERDEQETLIAGLLWMFWYRIWPTFSRQFEVLMVEAASVDSREFEITASNGQQVPAILHLCSRPDVIVRDRKTHEIVAVNWKTINSISDERRQNIANSLQVNLEAFYAEKLYSKWVDEEFVPPAPPDGMRGRALMQYYEEAGEYYKTLPREVAYTQIVYLVKGNRQLLLADGTEVANELEGQYQEQEKFWRQDSALCYRWVNLEPAEVEEEFTEAEFPLPSAGRKRAAKPKAPAPQMPAVSWSYRYYKSGNKSYNNLAKGYARQGVWEADDLDPGAAGYELSDLPMGELGKAERVREHVHRMNAGRIFPSTLNAEDERNAANPLDALVFFENPIYRDVESQREFVTSTLVDEMKVAEALVRVRESDIVTPADGETIDEALAQIEPLDDVLTREFPKRLISCRKPTKCEFSDRICNVPKDSRQPLFTILPAGSSWVHRTPHHAAELEAFNGR